MNVVVSKIIHSIVFLYLPIVVQNSGNDAVIKNVSKICLLVLTINIPIPAITVPEEYKFCCNLEPT